MAKNKYYRLETKCSKMLFFDVTLSDEYKKKYLDKRQSLEVNHLGQRHVPEMYHTREMLEDAWVARTDEDGRFETPDDGPESKALAKMICRHLTAFAGIDGWLPLEEKNKMTIAFWKKVIDRSSPPDLLEELSKELLEAKNPAERRSRLEEKIMAAEAASKVK